MKYLPVKSKQFGLIGAMVDDEDYDRLQHFEYTLSTIGYPRRAIKDSERMLHYDVLNINPVLGLEVDHIDRNKLNAQRSNLHLGSKAQNRQNSKRSKWGYLGVKQNSWSKRFEASIQKGGIPYYLGSFATVKEAARAYDKKAFELFGPTATLNFPQ